MTTRIHIVTLPGEDFMPKYLISQLADIWREQGCSISVGPLDRIDCDIAIMHIDETWVESGSIPANPGNRPILNGEIRDISKRTISGNILDRDSDYKGPVIIKTNSNCFGRREARRMKYWSLKGLRSRMVRKIPWQIARELPFHDYPILDGISAVPGWVWKRKDLVVEKFRAEMEGDEFILQSWVFFGDREYGVRVFGNNPIVKAGNSNRHEYITDFPDKLRELRARFKLDFGKIDYVICDGEPVVFDVNKTPTVSAKRSTKSDNLPKLAEGLKHYLDNRQ